jgi:hypothetical protein
MESSGMLRCAALVSTDVLEDLSASFVTLMREALRSSETSVLTRATWRNIPENTILHRHRRENIKADTLYKLILSLHHGYKEFFIPPEMH